MNRMNPENAMQPNDGLASMWQRLSQVNSLTFESTSQANESGWSGQGRGAVVVETIDSVTMLFHEKGTWNQAGGRELTFTNVYRWTALHEVGALRLEHLRFGVEHPVYLFDLQQTESGQWRSVEGHMCREDCYQAAMTLGPHDLRLRWTIKGPGKDETIGYVYHQDKRSRCPG